MRLKSISLFTGLVALLPLAANAVPFAITKQISPIDLSNPALVELTGVSKLPQEIVFKSLTTPQGITLKSSQTTDCASTTGVGSDCRERFLFSLDAVTSGKCNLTGSYTAHFDLACRAGMTGCTPTTQDVDFSLQSENFCTEHTVNTTNSWGQITGLFATDIGIGTDDFAWLTNATTSQGGYQVMSYNVKGATGMMRNGGAVRVDTSGPSTWVVNDTGLVYSYNGGWVQNTSAPAASDIGVGANGQVWLTAKNGDIYRLVSNQWQKVQGGANRIDVDPQGNAWTVNGVHEIWRYNGSGWNKMPGAALDIGIGANGAVFVVGTAGDVYKWNGSTWDARGGSNATSITVSAQGVPIIVNASHEVFAGQP